MQLFHFIAAWLFPGATVSKAAAKAAIAESMESSDNASSLAFSVKAADDSGSSVSSSSSPSSSSSTSDDHHPRFFASRQEHSPPSSPLCFGAGGRGVGRLLLRGSRGARARSPTKRDEVARYLRRISRRLRKARRAPDKKGSPSPGRAEDDTARERAESVARAIAYCKDTLRCGAAPPRPPPSPSLDDWLHDRQEEIIASAAAYCDGSTDSRIPQTPGPPRLDGGSLAAHHHRGIECSVSPPTPLRPHRAGELAQMQAMAKQGKESTCSILSRRDSSIDVVYGEELPPLGHDALDSQCRDESATVVETAMASSPSDLAADELRMPSSFDEIELMKILDDGDEEMIGRHFITIQI